MPAIAVSPLGIGRLGYAWLQPAAALVGAVTVALNAGCASAPKAVRMGDPVPLITGEPRTECEGQSWLEFVPSRAFIEESETVGASGDWITIRTVTEDAPGYAVYRPGVQDPLDLRTVFPLMQEPALERSHMQRIKPTLDAESRSRTLNTVGLVILAGSLAMTAVDPIIGSAGAVVSLGFVFAAHGAAPNADQRAFARTRMHMLLPGEDDLQAGARGVGRANAAVRRECGGATTPLTDPQLP